MSEDSSRRPVASRDKKIFHRWAHALVAQGLTPNQISVLSSLFSVAGALGFYVMAAAPSMVVLVVGLLVVLVGIQGRLICNLLDGLMAVEGGLKTKTGELFNEIPDRVSDTVIFLGAASSVAPADAQVWGYLASLFAMATAYLRVLGASAGAPHFFAGPMAKQHRMFLMNLCAIGCAVEKARGEWGLSIKIALAVIAIGSLVTCANRLRLIARNLNSR